MNKLILSLIILLSFVIRVWKIDSFAGFDFDQETAINISQTILNGKPTLIGQEISIGGVYLAPYYNYTLALVLFLFKQNPSSIFIFHAVIGTISTYLIYYISEKITPKSGILTALFYTFSYQFIYLDKTAAPSNLLVFFTLLVLCLHLSKLNSLAKLVITSIIISFASSTHPSAISLIVLPIIQLSHTLRTQPVSEKTKKITIFFLCSLVGFLPLILFDIRHQNIITKNLLRASDVLVNYPIYFRFLQRLNLFVDFSRKLFFPINFFNALFYLLAFTPLVLKHKHSKHTSALAIITILGFIIFTIYKGPVPEYYLLPSFVTLFILICTRLYQTSQTSLIGKIFATSFTFIFLTLNIYYLNTQKNPYSLANKKQIITFIKNTTTTINPNIHIVADLGQNNGFKYLANWMKIEANFSDTKPDFIIFVPDQPEKSDHNAGSIGVQKVVN